MDKSRYTEISGREAANRLLDDLDIYSKDGNRYYMQDGTVWMESGELAGHVRLTIAETLSRKWYVKKPFDVRAEMLARPNEWVGAYEYKERWFKVRFNDKEMRVETYNLSNGSFVSGAMVGGFDFCIPIEDVPQEEWK